MNNAYIRLMIYLYTSEKNSADYMIAKVLLSYFSKFPNILIEDIAKQAHTTAATVTKFSHKLGYKNFKELRMDCQNIEVCNEIDQQLCIANTNYDTACSQFFQKEQSKLSFYKDAHSKELVYSLAEYFYNVDCIGVCYPPYAYSSVHVLRNYVTPLHKEVVGVMREVDVPFMEERVQSCEIIIIINLQGRWIKDNIMLCKRWKEQKKKLILITTVYDEDFNGIPDEIIPFYLVGETIMDSAYQISILFVKVALACANFPKLEKSKS